MTLINKQPLKINLQLFADGAPEGGQAPTAVDQLGSIFDSDSTAQPDTQAQDGQQAPQGAPQEPQQGQQPQVQPQQQEPQELILGKFKNTDEVFKSYRNQEAALTKAFMDKATLAKEKAALETKLQELEAKVNQPTIPQPTQQFQQQSPQPQQAQEPEINPEQFLETFYKDPIGSLKKIVEDTTKSVTEKVKADMQAEYKPVLTEFQQQKVQGYWNSAYSEFVTRTTDFEQYIDTMQEFMSSTGMGNETDPSKIAQNIQFAYQYAKGATATASTLSNPDDLLKDETFVAKLIESPEIKQKIIDQHMQTIQQNRPPQVINAAGGMAPAAPPPEIPKTKNDAARLAGAIFDSNFTNS